MDDRNPLSLLRSVREGLQTVQRQVDYLIAVLDSQTKDGLEGITSPTVMEKSVDLGLINSVLGQMTGKRSQEEILEVLIARAAECADRVILFDVETETLKAWKGAGMANELLSGIAVTGANSPLVLAAQTGQVFLENEHVADTLPWLSELGSLPTVCLCVPLAFGSYVPLVLYADSSTTLDAGSLELLGRLAVLQMQNHYLAHLLQEGVSRETNRQIEEATVSEMREASDQDAQEEGGENWGEAELLGGEGGALESVSLTEEEEEAAHEEARRLARLLVAEIKLYNEEEVEQGRQNAELYRRLRTDIDRSRKMYEKRVHPLIKAQADYFDAEVVRVLAQDDPDLMGSDYERSDLSSPINQGDH